MVMVLLLLLLMMMLLLLPVAMQIMLLLFLLLLLLLSADEALVDPLMNDVTPKASNVMGILYFGMLYGLTGHLQVRGSALRSIHTSDRSDHCIHRTDHFHGSA